MSWLLLLVTSSTSPLPDKIVLAHVLGAGSGLESPAHIRVSL